MSNTTTHDPKRQKSRPRRCYTLSIEIGADDWAGVMSDLKHIVDHIKECGERCSSVMGGPSSGYIVNIHHDPGMTHDRYFEILDAYIFDDAKKAEWPEVRP